MGVHPSISSTKSSMSHPTHPYAHDLKRLRKLATTMDNAYRLPVIGTRIGWDAISGACAGYRRRAGNCAVSLHHERSKTDGGVYRHTRAHGRQHGHRPCHRRNTAGRRHFRHRLEIKVTQRRSVGAASFATRRPNVKKAASLRPSCSNRLESRLSPPAPDRRRNTRFLSLPFQAHLSRGQSFRRRFRQTRRGSCRLRRPQGWLHP